MSQKAKAWKWFDVTNPQARKEKIVMAKSLRDAWKKAIKEGWVGSSLQDFKTEQEFLDAACQNVYTQFGFDEVEVY